MSRIGKKPISIPSSVTTEYRDGVMAVRSSKGALSYRVPDSVEVILEDRVVSLKPKDNTKLARSQWGTARATLANLVEGVSNGFTRKLEINGVGYRAALSGRMLKLSLGYSHEIEYALPEGISAEVAKPTEITISGIDRQRVGQVAAEIRNFRPPEPYRGKGIKYSEEFIFRKEGKKK